MTHGSLFSGGGGFDLTGWETILQSEVDPFCNKVLKYYWPNADNVGDIRQFDAKRYAGKIDVLTDGFPCQPFSTAGKRKGTADQRHLWPEMLRVIREIKPRWVVARMYTASLVGTKGWFSNRCMLIWKLRDTKYKRTYFQLAASVLPIDDTGYGSLLTLKTPRLIPTPTVMDSTGATAKMKSSQVKEGSMRSITLSRWAALLPTATARDWKGCRKPETLARSGRSPSNSLPDCAVAATGETGLLNPLFVEKMMGFPSDWTTLPFQNGGGRA